jgi:hypothetical protein
VKIRGFDNLLMIQEKLKKINKPNTKKGAR